MDIVEFFQQSAGKWSSMRTSHHPEKPQQGGRSTIEIELLENSDAAVVKLCELTKTDPALVSCAVRTTWDTANPWDEEKPGTRVLVAIADSTPSNEGKLIRDMGIGKPPIVGRYSLEVNDELTMVVESDAFSAHERLWFESENVRLRHSIVQRSGGASIASFCSEVRMGVAKPAENA